MAQRASKVKVDTVQRDLSAIRDLSHQYGFPIEWKDFPQITMLKKGLYKVYGQSPPDKRKPVTFEVLKQFYNKLDLNDFDQLMYFTWMVVMTTSMLRTSEGAAKNKNVSPFKVDKNSYSALWVRNLQIIRDDNDNTKVKYMILTLKGTKTDINHHGFETVIGHGVDPINPVKLMLIYLLKRQQLSVNNNKLRITAFAPLFIFSDGIILTVADATKLLKTLAKKCKLKGTYAGQSFRMGGGTSYSARNFQDIVVRKGGRWKSDAFQSYIRLDNEFFADLPFRALIAQIQDPNIAFGFPQ